jgi:S-DNA-T family DNA segregation ATPase FtsK/SpoIIIE
VELLLRARSLDGPDIDVVVDVLADHTIGELARALAGEIGLRDQSPVLTLVRTGHAPDSGATVGSSGIVSGDEVIVGFVPNLAPAEASPREAVSVDVLAGPDAGSSSSLVPGLHAIGRDVKSDVVIGDPTVSRRHIEVDISEDWIATVGPRGDVANPVTVNDVVIDGPTSVDGHDVVGLGGTRLAFRHFSRAADERIDQLGQIEFQRTPYRPPVVIERRAPDLGPIPTERETRRFQVLTALAPLAAGLTFFAFTRQPQFLVLTLLSPIVMIANNIEDRRSGRKRFRADVADFEQRILDWRAEIDQLIEDERVERLRAAPDLADLARRAELRTVDLWARGREAPDFLRLRVGLGTVAPLTSPEVGGGGDADLRRAAVESLDGTDLIRDVPISVDVAGDGVVGIHGPDDLVAGVASSMVIQAGCLHSPEDLAITAAVDDGRPLAAWIKWLPHARSVTSPLGGNHVVTADADVAELVGRLLEVAEFRTSGSQDGFDRRWPWILAILDARLAPDPADVARLLDLCPAAGISVIWLADAAGAVPRQAIDVLATRHGPGASLVGTMWSTNPEVADQTIEVEQIRLDVADRVARALAPIRDASTASLASSIPRTAPLLDVLGVSAPTVDGVTGTWLRDTGYGLPFPIGMGADGPLIIDLVEDGPHALIGGTSGAGKSELMQSIVASLAMHHSPERLNFLFVDYKGGASSNVFGDLPHTVGYVTNLSAELSLRALTSLRAELNRRMATMEGRAKDLAEMLERYPSEAPPSLVIVVDEFATLVKEVPEFVAGIVDIAQRGRSLGIHLILATQRPSGSVNENILANTNLRISLRMLDAAESNSVVGSPDAADIPVPLRGRAFARLGPRQLVAFQSAYCGAPLISGEADTPILTARFEATDSSPRSSAGSSETRGGTHLDAVLDAVRGASNRLHVPPPREPWREVLPRLVALDAVLDDPRAKPAREHPGRTIAVGMLDVPEQQDQSPALVDLEEGGGWLVFGSGGSGKTTALRTLAVSAAALAAPGEVEIIGIDFASRGLPSILPLPSVVDVATGDDLEAVTRHISGLHAELQRRREMLASAHAEHLTAYNERNDPLPRIILLIDGFGGLMSVFLGGGSTGSMALAVPLEAWTDMLSSVIVDGRQVGIHTVITADRRADVPSRIHSSISNRLVLRHADETGYGDHGVSLARAKGLDLSPGCGLWQADATVQIAAVSTDATAKGQGATIGRFASSLEPSTPSRLASQPLPERVERRVFASAVDVGPLTFPLALADLTGETVAVELTWSNMVVAGPPRSGRSTALSTCAHGLAGRHRLWGVGTSASALDRDLFDEVAFGRPDEVAPLLDRLANLLDMGPSDQRHVLLIDDLDLLDDMSLNSAWERVARADGLRIVASLETRSIAGFSTNPLLTALKRARRLLVLEPDDAAEVLQATGVKSPVRPGQRMVAGRGVLIADRQPRIVQVAVD